jgi:hypothetical protein
MTTWTSIILFAVVLTVGGAIYIRLRWHRSPRAYQAMLAVAVCYFVAGALAGAWVLRLFASVAPVRETAEPAKAAAGIKLPRSEPTELPLAGTTPALATPSDEDTEVPRQFCADHRDASVTAKDFLIESALVEQMLRPYPAESPPSASHPSMHESTLADVCDDWRREGQPLHGFCVGIESSPETESLTPAEFLRLNGPITKTIRYRAHLDPARPFPGSMFNLNPTLADICRDAGF